MPSRDARSPICLEKRAFTGALKYNNTAGEFDRDNDSSEVEYFGNPYTTPGIDRAWKTLLRGGSFALPDDEAGPYFQNSLNRKVTGGHVYAELDVFHSLNCLNAVRIALDKDYYSKHGPQDGLGWQ